MNSISHNTIKIILLGDSGVGKTCLIHKYINNTFSDYINETIGVDFVCCDYTSIITHNKFNLYIWDTAGQERYKALSKIYYHGSHGAIICFDVNNIKSFNNVETWINEIYDIEPSTNIILCGTKNDLNYRQVNQEDAINYAKLKGISYIETSSKTGLGVNNVFTDIIEHIIEHNRIKKLNSSNSLTNLTNSNNKIQLNISNSRIILDSNNNQNQNEHLNNSSNNGNNSYIKQFIDYTYAKSTLLKNTFCNIV